MSISRQYRVTFALAASLTAAGCAYSGNYIETSESNVTPVSLTRTSRGDLVLDNLNGEIKLWKDVPYTFLKMQSASNPIQWLTIGGQINDDQVASPTASL